MLYDRDNNYFFVRESIEQKNKSGRSAIQFLSKFDEYKNSIEFPKGNYSYYTVNLLSTDTNQRGSLADQANQYVLSKHGVNKGQGDIVDRSTFMVYGEPTGKGDYPIICIMPKR